MSEAQNPNPSRRRTLAALQGQFLDDVRGAEELLMETAPEAAKSPPFKLIPLAGGSPQLRTDVESSKDGLTYESFNPPPMWDAPFSILKVFFEPVADQTTLMHHLGEELLVPTLGRVEYRFHWSPGGRPLKRDLLDPPVKPGSIVRVNCGLPHHGRLPEDLERRGEAWMIFYHPSTLSTAISFDQRLLERAHINIPSRRINEDELGRGATYALTAWGLSELIRLRRLATNLHLAEVAEACGITRSHLARIEAGTTNVSLATLFTIAEFLHIDIAALIRGSRWNYIVDDLASKPLARGAAAPHVGCRDWLPSHMLHAVSWNLSGGTRRQLTSSSPFASWIALSGQVAFDIRTPASGVWLADRGDGAEDVRRLVQLEPQSVLHFKGRYRTTIEAVEDSQLLEIRCGHECGAPPHR